MFYVGEKLYKITLKPERKYSEMLTMVVAGVYTSKIFYFCFTVFVNSLALICAFKIFTLKL